jgi:hypothetical protein
LEATDGKQIRLGGTFLPSIGPVILIASCEAYRHNGFNAAARETWLSIWADRIAYKFVLGRGSQNLADDEIVLDVDDGYEGLVAKVQASRRWATENGHDYTFHCGADTYVFVPRLLASGYEKHDYSGFLIHDEHRMVAERNVQFAQGGGGYWLGPQAATSVEKATIPAWIGKAEDLFVADALFKAGILPVHESCIWSWGYRAANDPDTLEGGPFVGLQSAITIHLSRWWAKPSYQKAWMYDTHNRALPYVNTWERKFAPAPPPDVP